MESDAAVGAKNAKMTGANHDGVRGEACNFGVAIAQESRRTSTLDSFFIPRTMPKLGGSKTFSISFRFVDTHR